MKEQDELEELEEPIKRVKFSGGAILKAKVRKRSPKRNEKIEQALATKVGGAILKEKVRKRSPKKDEKIMQALATKVGGSLKYYDRTHKYMINKLSGHGARRDSVQCRSMMHNIMSKYHPSIWNSYLAGRVKDLPRFENDHLQTTPKPRRADPVADIIETGGSLNRISHSENGYLTAHNSEFHHYIEIV